MEHLHVARTPGPDEGEARHHEDPFTSPARPAHGRGPDQSGGYGARPGGTSMKTTSRQGSFFPRRKGTLPAPDGDGKRGATEKRDETARWTGRAPEPQSRGKAAERSPSRTPRSSTLDKKEQTGLS